jgi:ribosomal-protein-serine acetyltransferase
LKVSLPWIDGIITQDDTRKFIQSVIEGYSELDQIHCSIFYNNQICGVLGFNSIDKLTRPGHIGYWLAKDFNGKGVMTKCVSELMKIGFEEMNLNKMQIACSPNNIQSRNIPKRLGFKLEGVIRNSENLYGKIIDLEIYGLLNEEYKKGILA